MALVRWLIYGAGLTLVVAASLMLVTEPAFATRLPSADRAPTAILLLVGGIAAMAGARAAAATRAPAPGEPP